MAKHSDELSGLGRGDKGTERSVWPSASHAGNVEEVCNRCQRDYADAEDGLCTECWIAEHVMEDFE